MSEKPDLNTSRGFSLLELLIAMTLTLTVSGIASVMLARSLHVRTATNQNVDAVADAQRALNIMSREIANAGFRLSGNGIVDADSIVDADGNSTIRIRSNLNKFDSTVSPAAQSAIGVIGEDAGEDLKYFIHRAGNTNLLARYDAYAIPGGKSTVLANRLEGLRIHYYPQKVSYETSGCDITNASATEISPGLARYLVIAVCVQLGQVGTTGTAGYVPARNVLLVSDVALRNANLADY